jgi:hypothetical protein
MLAGLGLIVEEEDDKHPTQVASSSWWRMPALQLEDTRGPSIAEGIVSFGGGLDALILSEPVPVVPPPVEPELPSVPGAGPVGGGPAITIEGPTEEQFFAGWYDAGGGSLKDHAAAWRFVNCESTWNIYTPLSAYRGLTQFSDSTWAAVVAITGLGDVHNPYHVGFNTATWAHVSNPGTQWPWCWWV